MSSLWFCSWLLIHGLYPTLPDDTNGIFHTHNPYPKYITFYSSFYSFIRYIIIHYKYFILL